MSAFVKGRGIVLKEKYHGFDVERHDILWKTIIERRGGEGGMLGIGSYS